MLLLVTDANSGNVAGNTAQTLTQANISFDLTIYDAEVGRQIKWERYRLVIMDFAAPEDCALALQQCRKLGVTPPLLAVCYENSAAARIRLLECGADRICPKHSQPADYLAELSALISVLTRRRHADALHGLVRLGRLQLDIEGKRVFLQGQPLTCNRREWHLFRFFSQAANRVVGREELAQALGLNLAGSGSNTLHQILLRFRRRLSPAQLNLRTVRGVGYYLEATE